MQRFDRAAQEAMEPGLQEIAAEARAYPLLDYLDAVARREQLIVAANRFHQTYDLLVLPTLPLVAFEAGAEVPVGSGLRRWLAWPTLPYPIKLTQHPPTHAPCGPPSPRP